ncbi:MAG: nucleotidyltransferase domain-containing protein [Chloroflexi bacterium]|nr:MAG: nucleotidyltransferase domain-containing protein [Chloroflexota bacterium]
MFSADTIKPVIDKTVARIKPTGFSTYVADSLPLAVERLVANLSPKKIILFGSYAYGTPTSDSDVDLLVILDTNASNRDRFALVSRLLYPRSFPVDILVKTPDEIDQALENANPFIADILASGRILYERSS